MGLGEKEEESCRYTLKTRRKTQPIEKDTINQIEVVANEYIDIGTGGAADVYITKGVNNHPT